MSYSNIGKEKYRKISSIGRNILPYLKDNIGEQYGQDRAFSCKKSIDIIHLLFAC